MRRALLVDTAKFRLNMCQMIYQSHFFCSKKGRIVEGGGGGLLAAPMTPPPEIIKKRRARYLWAGGGTPCGHGLLGGSSPPTPLVGARKGGTPKGAKKRARFVNASFARPHTAPPRNQFKGRGYLWGAGEGGEGVSHDGLFWRLETMPFFGSSPRMPPRRYHLLNLTTDLICNYWTKSLQLLDENGLKTF